MKDLIRVILIDPVEESRNALQKLLRGIGSLWLSEVVNSFQDASARAGEITADVAIVVLDQDANQALELIQKLPRVNSGTVVLPASKCARQAPP